MMKIYSPLHSSAGKKRIFRTSNFLILSFCIDLILSFCKPSRIETNFDNIFSSDNQTTEKKREKLVNQKINKLQGKSPYINTCIRTYVCVCMYVCTNVAYVFRYVRMYVCGYLPTCSRADVHTCIYPERLKWPMMRSR